MRRLLTFLLITLAQVFLSAETEAQTQAPSCPAVKIQFINHGPIKIRGLDAVCAGSPVTFTADVEGISQEDDKPTFNWTVSGGKITDGQGTSTIKVLAEAPDSQGLLSAMVEVGGIRALKSECDSRAEKKIVITADCLLPCPAISVSCPTDLIVPWGFVTFSVNVAGGAPIPNLKYKWQVSAGKIISGQGTPEIKVDTSETDGNGITATVEVEGVPPECDRTESCSVTIIIDPAEARKFDEYGEISWISEEARLVNFGTQLKIEPEARGFVIIYGAGGRVNQHLARTRKFLVEKQGINPNRIRLINGGYNKKSKVELWIVPTGTTPPTANPNF